MRLRLTAAPRRRRRLGAWVLGAAALATTLASPRPLTAEDRIVLRGNYYREQSTRVLAPVVYVEKDLPDERFTVGAEYLLDAVTSASIGAGAAAVTGEGGGGAPPAAGARAPAAVTAHAGARAQVAM